MSLIKASCNKNMLIGLLIICIIIVSQISWDPFEDLPDGSATSITTSSSSEQISPAILSLNQQIATINEKITEFNAKTPTQSDITTYIEFLNTQLSELTHLYTNYTLIEQRYNTTLLTESEQQIVTTIHDNINKACNSSTSQQSVDCDNARKQNIPPDIKKKIMQNALLKSKLTLANTLLPIINTGIDKINTEISKINTPSSSM